MSANWSPWQIVGDSFRTTPGGPVTAISWDAGRFILFATDTNGEVFTTIAQGDLLAGLGDLTVPPWTSVSEGSSVPGAPITALLWGAQCAVFLADRNGGVYTTGGIQGYPFGPWALVGEPFRTTPGGPVTAVPWKAGQFVLFATDANGGVFTSIGDPQAGFTGWMSVSEGSTTPGAPIAAVNVPGTEEIAVFIADPNGGVYTAVGAPGQPYGPWGIVGDAFRTTPGAAISVDWQFNCVLYVTDRNGSVFSTFGDPRSHFEPWTLLPGITVVPGSRLTNMSPYLFATNTSGEVLTNAGVIGWQSVSEGKTLPGSPITACVTSVRRRGAQDSDAVITLFVADPAGGIYTAHLPWPSIEVVPLPPG